MSHKRQRWNKLGTKSVQSNWGNILEEDSAVRGENCFQRDQIKADFSGSYTNTKSQNPVQDQEGECTNTSS